MKVGELRNALKDVDGDIEVVAHDANDPIGDFRNAVDGFLLQGIVNGEVSRVFFVIGYE